MPHYEEFETPSPKVGPIRVLLCLIGIHCYHHIGDYYEDMLSIQVPTTWFCNKTIAVDGRKVKCCRCMKDKIRKFHRY